MRRKIFTQYVITQYPFWGLLAGYVILTGQRVFVTTNRNRVFNKNPVSPETTFAAMNQLTINISAGDFSDWLKDYTADVYLDFFPLSKGGCTLQPGREPLPAEATSGGAEASAEEGARLLVMDAFYWDGEIPRSGGVHPWPRAIVVEVVSLATERVAVSIRCQYAVLKTYYYDLLMAILLRWPETYPQIAQLDQTTDFTTEE